MESLIALLLGGELEVVGSLVPFYGVSRDF
jgi:hypothetical protein